MNDAFLFFLFLQAGYNFFEKKNRTWSILTSDQVVLFPPLTSQWEKGLESLRTRPVGCLFTPKFLNFINFFL